MRKTVFPLLISILFLSIFSQSNTSRPSTNALILHEPILIENDFSFTQENGVTGGSGTPADPYIIENWDIKANGGDCIHIANTNLFFVIRNVWVHNAPTFHKGIFLHNVTNGAIYSSKASDSYSGIFLEDSFNCSIKNNNATSNQMHGIHLHQSGFNILRENNMTDNGWNFGVSRSELNHFINDVDTSNTVNNRIVYYLSHQDNLTITPLTFPNTGYIAVINSTNINLRNLVLTNNVQGVLLAHVNNTRIKNLTISGNYEAIRLVSCSNNTIINNEIISNRYSIFLENSCNSSIHGNVASYNWHGIALAGAVNTSISENVLLENVEGIFVMGIGSRYQVYHNSFIENKKQVDLHGTLAESYIWDSNAEGNYWSDHNTTDSNNDGISDSPYIINDYNQDNYPLVSPYEYWSNPILGDINRDTRVDMTDIDILQNAYGSTTTEPHWNPHADLNQDGRIDYKDLYQLASNYGENWTYP